jgi:hypothetical protein
MGLFGKSRSELVTENEALKKENNYLQTQVMDSTDVEQKAELKIRGIRQDHRWELANLISRHQEEISDLNRNQLIALQEKSREIEVMEYNWEEKLNDEITVRQNKLEKENEIELARLKKELKAEYQAKFEKLEKKVADLTEESLTLAGENGGLTVTIGILEDQLGSMATLTDKIITALPEIRANLGLAQPTSAPKENKQKDQS